MTSSVRTTVVIGIGVDERSDDGCGRLVAEALSDALPPAVAIHSTLGEAAELIDLWSGASCAVVIDAVRTGSAPGTLLRFDASDEPLPAAIRRSSTHDMGLHEAIELSRALGTLPARLIVIGIEGTVFAHGTVRSEPVRRAVSEAVRLVKEEIGSATTHERSPVSLRETP
jgi:hydrogenase maturation protease